MHLENDKAIERIKQNTGATENVCGCLKCQHQCRSTPCIGTPDDVIKLLEAGYGARLAPTLWLAGIVMGVINTPVPLIASIYDNDKKACTFFKDGLCELHDLGLKPTEGRLSNHEVRATNLNPHQNIAWNVVQEWMKLEDPTKVNYLMELVDKHIVQPQK